jgi:uncharacterized membrane protein HdeD (DUF308 family)
MHRTLAPSWWVIGLRGLVALALGICAVVWPIAAATVLVTVFGVYAFVDGAFAVASGLRSRAAPRWWLLLCEGMVGAAAGLVVLMWPDITLVLLVYIVASWAMVTGALEITVALRLQRQAAKLHGLLLGAGVASLTLGVALFFWPIGGVVALSVIVGAYCLVFGGAMLSLAFRLRAIASSSKESRHHETGTAESRA